MTRLERLSHLALIALGAVAVVAALEYGAQIFAPLALAFVGGIVLSPVSDFWERRGLPPVVGALTSLALTLMIAGGLVLIFHPVVVQIVDQAPKVLEELRGTLDGLRSMAESFRGVTESVSSAVSPEAAAAAPEAEEEAVNLPTVADAVMIAPAIVAQILIFAGGLFFFLLTRTELYEFAARRMADPADRASTARRLRDAEGRVARYFVTISLINAGLGVATAIALQAIGLPSALLWGLVAFVLNFVLYLGPALVVVSLLAAGVAAFDGLVVLLPAATFLTLNAIEAQFVTPTMVGRSLSLNPLVVFVALVFGIWLWGPIGGIVAMPILLWILVLNDGLKPAAEPSEAAA